MKTNIQGYATISQRTSLLWCTMCMHTSLFLHVLSLKIWYF